MDSVNYLSALGRQWKVVGACVLVALVVGLVVTGGEDDRREPAGTNRLFEATTYLLPTSGAGGTFRTGESSMLTASTLVTLGDVPRNVAEAIGFDGDARELADQIAAGPDDESGMLLITATDERAAQATLLADTFAEELLSYLAQQTIDDFEALRQQVRDLERDIERAIEEEAAATNEADRAAAEGRRTAAETTQAFYETQLAQLTFQVGTDPSGFEIIEPATAREVPSSDGFQAPRSRAIRLAIAGGLGLLLGIALALLLERVDTKIRTKDDAEASFKLPVLVEIPAISRRRRRKGSVVTDAFPRSHETNAFRLLAAALQFGRHEGTLSTSATNGSGSSRTIVVTSPNPAEGKSTIVANLAATFAEIGKRVVVLCCDFRHPTLHTTFAIEQGPGLAEALESEGDLDLEPLLQPTAIERIHVIATGFLPNKSAGLFGSPRIAEVLAKARAHADIVLIDTAPVLTASDWTQLLPEVDSVLVVARAGRTDSSSAESTAEILTIVQAPVVGVALNRLPRSVIRRSGFRYGYLDRYRSERDARATVEPVRADFSLNGDTDLLSEEPEATAASGDATVEAAAADEAAGVAMTPARSRRALRRERAKARAESVADDLQDDSATDATASTDDSTDDATDDSTDDAGDTRDGGIPHLVRPSSKE